MRTRAGRRVRGRWRILLVNRQRKETIDGRTLRRFLSLLPQVLESPVKEVAVVLVSDRRIASLNRRYLRHEGPTDVITFDYGPTDILAYRLSPSRADLVVSAETAARNARAYGNSFADEVVFLAAHGVLHLRGYDDSSARGRACMESVQRAALARVRRMARGCA